MILDKNLVFCENSPLSAGDSASDVVDLGAAGDILEMEPVLVVVMTEGAAGGTSALFRIETAGTSDFSAKTVLAQSDTIPMASLVRGKKALNVKLPRGLRRYVRIFCDVTGSFTAGKYSAFMTPGEHVGA